MVGYSSDAVRSIFDKYSGYLDIIAVVAIAVFIVWIVYSNTRNRGKGNITDNI